MYENASDDESVQTTPAASRKAEPGPSKLSEDPKNLHKPSETPTPKARRASKQSSVTSNASNSNVNINNKEEINSNDYLPTITTTGVEETEKIEK